MEEKEGRASSDPKGQEDLGGNEADSKDEDSETDYSSGDEEVLTKAGRLMSSMPHGFVGAVPSPHSAGCPTIGSLFT